MSISFEAPVVVRSRPRPLERVEAEIVSLSSQLTAATARLVELIGEFDAAEGWRDWGMRSTAQWLSWKTGIGLHAGREQVRVARALRGLPLMTAAFAAGRLSYSKVRALTRLVSVRPESEADLVQMAEHTTGSQIEKLAAAARRARRGAEVQARRKAAYIRWHQDEDGSIVGSFRVTPETGSLFIHGLDAATGRLIDLSGEDDPTETKDARRARSAAEALGVMAEAFLKSVSAETSSESAERYQLVLHTTAEELAKSDDAEDEGAGTVIAGGNGRQWRIAPSTARRLTCDCPTSTMIDGPDGAALHLGRKTRRIRGRTRRAVVHRDGGMCRTPGCTEPATQIHHVRHWAHGGPTCLRNLISLCDHHHWLVHEGGFTLVPKPGGGWLLLSADGVRLGPTPEPPATVEPLPTDSAIAPDAVSGHWDGSKLNAADAVSILLRLDVPPRPKKTRAVSDEYVSTETWEPIDWPVHDDYPGEPWIGADDPFFALE